MGTFDRSLITNDLCGNFISIRRDSKVPIKRILDVLGGYHRDSFGQVKQFVALGERLKSTETKTRILG